MPATYLREESMVRSDDFFASNNNDDDSGRRSITRCGDRRESLECAQGGGVEN